MLSAPVFAQDSQEVFLPALADSALTDVYPGWQYADSYRGAAERLRWYDEFNWPWLWEGDFDGNGVRDYSVNIKYKDSLDVIHHSVVAVLSKDAGYEVMYVGRGGDGQALWVIRKGRHLMPDYAEDLEEDYGDLMYSDSDAIALHYDGKPHSVIWIWREGKFVNLYSLVD